jgi:hypothetical protein
MKLSLNYAEIENGRNLLKAAIDSYDQNKLDIFYVWLQNNVVVDHKLVNKTFDKLFQVKSGDRILGLYDAMMTDYNPTKDLIKFIVAKLFTLFILAGLLGGVVYLFKCCID